MRRILQCIAIVLLPATSWGSSTFAEVRDPQGHPVPDARVEYRCQGGITVASTDHRGRFPLDDARRLQCRVRIALDGFTPVESDAVSVPPIVHLRLAVVTETVEVRAPRLTIGGRDVAPSISDFRERAATASDLIAYSKLLAGVSTLPTALYVDGLPASTLPPIDMIERLSVDDDIFSGEFADGDAASVRITTRLPGRRLRVSGGTSALDFGGRNLLAHDSRTSSGNWNVNARGLIPGTNMGFWTRANASRSQIATPVRATVGPDAELIVDATGASVTRSTALDWYYPISNQSQARVSVAFSSNASTNRGVGGIALVESGTGLSAATRDVRVAVTHTGNGFTLETGAAIDTTSASTRANGSGIQISVPGSFLSGGALIAADDSRRLRWTARHVVRTSSERPWSFGVISSGWRYSDDQQPNPAGFIEFDSLDSYLASTGDSGGTYMVSRGNGRVRAGSTATAAFVERNVVITHALTIRAGLRADHQPQFGIDLSPRLSFSAVWAGLEWSGGTGVFVKPISESVLTRLSTTDGRHLHQWMATDVPLSAVSEAPLEPAREIVSRLDTRVDRPRELLRRVAVQRRIGTRMWSLDYTRTQGQHLLGSARLLESDQFVDMVQSNRTASRHRVHTQLRQPWHGHEIVGNYEWAHSKDNTDGAFSFAERSGDLANEWARSTGIPAHTVSLMASLRLPKSTALNLVESWHGAAPYNITTPFSPRQDGLRVDRNGLPRNSGSGPHYNSLDVYAFRQFTLKALRLGKTPLRLNAGVQANNLLGNRNYWSLGSIYGSPTFGQPLGAMPGRSFRTFMTFD